MSSFDLQTDFESSLSLQSSTNSRSFDFDGLEESLVDESEESLDDSRRQEDDADDSCLSSVVLSSRETSFHRIRDALIRDAQNRSDEDLDLIQDFLELIIRHKTRHSLRHKDFQTKRLLAKHMVLAEIEARDTRVLTDGERLDAYCVVACGSLRHVTGGQPLLGDDSCVDCVDGDCRRERHCRRLSSSLSSASVRYLLIGDEFGAQLDDRVVFGEIFTNEDFVWVLCVPHVIFDEICGEKSLKTVFDEKNEKIIEIRNQFSNELLRASKERLLELLLGDRRHTTTGDDTNDLVVDDTLETQFISDFLLTFRLFWSQSENCVQELVRKLVQTIRSERNVEKCLKVVLFWISNHFQDFQRHPQLLQEIESSLKSKIHKKLFYFALSSKSRDRHVTITRSDRAAELPFTLCGGYQFGTRLFVSDVHSAEDCPEVQRGDRLLAINGVDCHVMEVSRAEQLCRQSTHLSLHVQFDPHLFHMLLDGQISRNSSKSQLMTTTTTANDTLQRTATTADRQPTTGTTAVSSQTSFATLKAIPSLTSTNFQNWRQKVLKMVQNVNQKTREKNNALNNNTTATTTATATTPLETPEVIKIHFESDFRYLAIHATTSARECIQLALIEFQLDTNYSSRDFALYEYKLIDKENGTSAVKRLSDNNQNLAQNLSLNSRLYLKCVSQPQAFSHPQDCDVTREITKESPDNSLLSLDACEIARELFERDFELFCRIESQQFIYDLGDDSPRQTTPLTTAATTEDDRRLELKAFEEKTNQELFWTINRILFDTQSVSKRVKCVKQLIKVALVCRQLKNFNALFAIISGLSHQSIQRMKQLFERIPQKSLNKLKKLYKLMDPSKNFSEFRQQLRHCESPIIPFFPLVKKDLSFIDLANQTLVEAEDRKSLLINWEKMRLLGHKCREVQQMTTRATTPTTDGRQATTALFANHLKALNDTKESNYRRIWERQRMRKRVQHFLDSSFSDIVCDENQLLDKSLECEPQPNDRQTTGGDRLTTPSTTASQRSSLQSSLSSQAVMPSPTLSSHSSSPSLSSSMSSNTNSSDVQSRLRFGVRDDIGLRKLLSLSDNCTHRPSHSAIGGQHPLMATGNSHVQCPRETTAVPSPLHVTNRFSQNFCQKTRLPEESSSVTSLRRLEQFHQLSRFREQFLPVFPPPQRPLLPSYDQTIQRMKKKFQKEENIV